MVTSAASDVLVEWKSAMMSDAPAELMVDAMGLYGLVSLHSRREDAVFTHDRSVINETIEMAVVFFPLDQFIGFSGSSGPSKSTKFGSFELSGTEESITAESCSTSLSRHVVEVDSRAWGFSVEAILTKAQNPNKKSSFFESRKSVFQT